VQDTGSGVESCNGPPFNRRQKMGTHEFDIQQFDSEKITGDRHLINASAITSAMARLHERTGKYMGELKSKHVGEHEPKQHEVLEWEQRSASSCVTSTASNDYATQQFFAAIVGGLDEIREGTREGHE